MLGQLNMFDKKDKLHKTLDRICEFEPKEGYYLAFSGGKDSQTIYHLAKMAGVKFDAHFNLTTVDPPELVYFIRKNYPDVEEHHPEKSMWKLIVEKGSPPMRMSRYCCAELKENGGSGRVVLTGIRWEESTRRAKRRMTEVCMKDKSKIFLHPVIDWGIDEIWDFLSNKEHCCLYDEGWQRIGCIGCPMATTKQREQQFIRYPKYYNAYLKVFAKILEKGKFRIATTPEELMHWWIYNPPKGDPDQTIMIE